MFSRCCKRRWSSLWPCGKPRASALRPMSFPGCSPWKSTSPSLEERSPQTVAEYRARLTAKLTELLNGAVPDENRILTEVGIIADRLAVDEETVRLRSHFAQLRKILESTEPVGRKLDFLTQELNRETNTIGSKCQDLAITRMVVDTKAEIEKIREQIQNIE